MTAATPTPNMPDRAAIAKETNGHIRALARSFHDEREVGFLCECGCMKIVLATLATYDEQGGIWIEAHSHLDAA